nr:unnamed protein product [Haemonchus contortus]
MAASNTSRRLKNAGFIKSPELTSSFIRTLWRRTEALLQLSKVNIAKKPGATMSISSLRSAFSTLSLSSTQTQNSAALREVILFIVCISTMNTFRAAVSMSPIEF